MVLTEKKHLAQQFSEKITQLPDEDFLTLMEIAWLFWNHRATQNSQIKTESEVDKLIFEKMNAEFNTAKNSTLAESPNRLFGCLKNGILYMSDDFDAPLEDFNEYMY